MLAQQLVHLPFCFPTGCGAFRVWTPRWPGWQPQRRETSSLKFRLASWRSRLETVRTKNFIDDRNKSVQSCEGESRLLLARRAVYWWQAAPVRSPGSQQPSVRSGLQLLGLYPHCPSCTRAARVRVPPSVSSARPMSARDTAPGAAGSCDQALPLATCQDAEREFLHRKLLDSEEKRA